MYRARFEGAFVRYRWYDSAGGAAGYWTAEQPDGSIAYYGADERGTPVRAARVETASGQVYRWHVVAVVDRFGHAIRYSYAKDGEYSLIDEIDYAHDHSGSPLYSVRFAYEDRPDAITTGEAGFLLALARRVRRSFSKHKTEIGLAALNAAGQGMIAGPAAAGVAAAMTVGGMALGGGIRRPLLKANIKLPERAQRALRTFGRALVIAGAVTAVGGFAVGLISVTGGGALIAGSVVLGAWSAARVIAGNSYVDYGGVGSDAVTLRERGGGPRVSPERVQGTADWVASRAEQMRVPTRL